MLQWTEVYKPFGLQSQVLHEKNILYIFFCEIFFMLAYLREIVLGVHFDGSSDDIILH